MVVVIAGILLALMIAFSGCGIHEYARPYPVCIEDCNQQSPKAEPMPPPCVPTWEKVEVCIKSYVCDTEVNCKENPTYCKECCEEKDDCKSVMKKVECK